MNLSKLDLKIELSPSQLMRADAWLHSFYSKCKSRMSDPIVENGFLKISSADIYNFLAAIEMTDENEFDRVRLKNSTVNQLKMKSKRKREPLSIDHYLATLDLFKRGVNGQI